MRRQEQVTLLLEHSHPDGTTTQESRPYTIKVSFEAWLQATRVNLPSRQQRILEIYREGKLVWTASGHQPPQPEPAPKSRALY